MINRRILVTIFAVFITLSTITKAIAFPDKFDLAGPSLKDWKIPDLWSKKIKKKDKKLARKYPLWATATAHRSATFIIENNKPLVIGYLRYGESVRASKEVTAPGCSNGKWHKIPGDFNFLVCTQEDIKISKKRPKTNNLYPPGNLNAAEPWVFAKADKGAPRFLRLPSAKDERLIKKWKQKRKKAAIEEQPKALHEFMDGIYFLALGDKKKKNGKEYYHTSMNRWVRAEEIKILKQSQMHGEYISNKNPLPIAFVYGKDRPLYRYKNRRLVKVGTAAKHSRINVLKTIKYRRKNYVVDSRKLAIDRNMVRVAKRISRPTSIPKGSKWLHLNLAEQTLVAYEDQKPVLATLISSGLDTHKTPTGTYMIQRRYISKFMAGPDPDHGVYEVAEVPWILFYSGNYALHGAYWHNVFGEQRSHGCTNVAPIDARWLFRWVEPKFPYNWYIRFYHAKSWAYFTD